MSASRGPAERPDFAFTRRSFRDAPPPRWRGTSEFASHVSTHVGAARKVRRPEKFGRSAGPRRHDARSFAARRRARLYISGLPHGDYEVAIWSRKNLPIAPEVCLIFQFESRPRTKQRAVSIDYPRSRRMGGNPSTGCNRARGVGASRCWTPEAHGTHSPSLDSRCSAFSGRSQRPGEFGVCGRVPLALPGPSQRMVRLVG
jgi:hypothetical protein